MQSLFLSERCSADICMLPTIVSWRWVGRRLTSDVAVFLWTHILHCEHLMRLLPTPLWQRPGTWSSSCQHACHSDDVDARKFQLVHHDTFYNGQIQQNFTECLPMLIDIINKGSIPDSSWTTYPTGASLSDILFSFVLEKYIVCNVCGLRSPSFESSSVLYITPAYASSMQDLILQGMQQKL